MRLNAALLATDAPPIPEAKRWLEGATFPPDRPLLNVSQAAPTDPPPEPLRRAIAEAALNDPDAHLYGPVLGTDALRAELAAEWSRNYDGRIAPDQVAITAGCNQAFVAVMSALAGAGDEVLLPTPWYFNHKMWLDMTGVRTVPLPCDAAMIPEADTAARLVTDRTRAIVLVTPNNPTGAEYPAETLTAFRDLARRHGIALVIDETYRDFHSRSGAPHDLFTDPDWSDTVIDLYSFSKTYRLTGHRVGAVIASESFLREMEKFQDTAIICPNMLGQTAALWGMRNLRQWVASERDEILDRRAAVQSYLGPLDGWEILGLGAYFAFVSHPFDAPSDAVARRLVREAGVLALPATMFAPPDDPICDKGLRIAFANIDRTQIRDLANRLAALA
ncbi:MAG: aminotransferase [Silicimonas sp.]|nr:aminotransferase [Silicimonas sp.]